MSMKVKIICMPAPFASVQEVIQDLNNLVIALKDKYPPGVEVEIEVPHLQLG